MTTIAASDAGMRNSPILHCEIYLPPQRRSDTPLVVVHGVETAAARMLSHFVTDAARAGKVVIAPDFSGPEFRGYQRLAGNEQAMRSATALTGALASLKGHHGLTENFDLVGFSGGAQFGHRYALFNPAKVRRLAVVAAGWYTYIDPTLPFPFGTAASPHNGMQPTDVTGFLAIPKLIAVGDADTLRDLSLRQSSRVDRTGRNRVERASRWHAHLDRLAPGRNALVLLPNTRHSVSEAVRQGGLSTRIFQFIASASIGEQHQQSDR